MDMIYKNIITLLVIAGMVPGAVAMAQTNASEGEAQKRAVMPERAFSCSSIGTMETATLAKVTERTTSITGAAANRNTERLAQKNARLAKLETERGNREKQRMDRYESMRAKATTTEQKAAVETFVETVEKLVADREKAIDAAIAAFENGVEGLRSEQDTVATTLSGAVTSEVRAIFDEAKKACTDTSTVVEIRQIVSDGMKDLRARHQADRANYTFRDEFEALRSQRRAAEQAAMAAFTDGLAGATETLKSSIRY
jgi:hypothetical protein